MIAFAAYIVGLIGGTCVGVVFERQRNSRTTARTIDRPGKPAVEIYETWGDQPVAGKIIPRDRNGNPLVTL